MTFLSRFLSRCFHFYLPFAAIVAMAAAVIAEDAKPGDQRSDAGGDFVIGPDFKVDPDLTDMGNRKGKSFEFSLKLADSKIFPGNDATLDAKDLSLAGEDVRRSLVALWNAEDSRLRKRLLDAMSRKAQARQAQVTEALEKRRDADIQRVGEIFDAFRANLWHSRERLAREIGAEEEKLFPDDQQAQRRRDLRAMEDRLESLDDEERREIASINERYRDIRPHVSAAAVVFALTPADAKNGTVLA